MTRPPVPKVRVLVMDGRIQSCLPVLKALRQAGHHVTIAESDPLCVGFFSRYPHRRIRHRDPRRNPEGFLEDLIRHLSKNSYDVLIPILDVTAELVSKYKPLLEQYVRIPLVDYPTFMLARDKSKTMKLAQSLGLPCPKTYFPDEMDLTDISQEVAYPVLIKPNYCIGARGITKVHNSGELLRLYNIVVNNYGPCTIQEYIPQIDSQFKAQIFLDRKGNVKASSVCEKLRYYPITGSSGCIFMTTERNDIAEIGVKLLKAMNWYGYGDIDFICDPRDRQVKIMEVNPRLSAPVKIVFESGINLAQMLINLSFGYEIKNYNGSSEGIFLRHEGRYLLGFVKLVCRFSAQPSWFRVYVSNLKYMILSKDDPAPILAYLLANLRDLFSSEARRYKFQRNYLDPVTGP